MAIDEDDIPTGEFEVDEDGVLQRPRRLKFNDLVQLKKLFEAFEKDDAFLLLRSEMYQPASDVVVSTIESGIGVAVPDHILSFYQAISDGVEFDWTFVEDGEEKAAGGFHLYNFGKVFGTWVDEVWGVVSPDATERERDFSWELRPIEAPYRGGQHYTVMHVPEFAPGYGLYYHNPNGTSHRLDLDFAAYFDCLLETRGFHGWQFLVSDVDFAKDDYARQRAEAFHTMMPRLFPTTDFSGYRTP
ncbi:MAG: hypothetical protein R3E66_06195 [bacterium]